MEKRFIVARSKDVTLLSEDELHDLLSLGIVSNTVIIDRDHMENASLAMCSDIVMKCTHNPLAFTLSMEMLKHSFDDKNYKTIDTLLTALVD